jgi:hypothetical protein
MVARPTGCRLILVLDRAMAHPSVQRQGVELRVAVEHGPALPQQRPTASRQRPSHGPDLGTELAISFASLRWVNVYSPAVTTGFRARDGQAESGVLQITAKN